MAVTLSIVVATAGRPSLTDTLASITPQLEWGDEVIVTKLECPYGHRARNLAIRRCVGTHVSFMDDDDRYADGALALVREKVSANPARVHLFAMRYRSGNRTLVPTPPIGGGGVGTPMIVVPRLPKRLLGVWTEDDYAGDWGFYESTMELRGDEPVCHPEVIALIG